MSSLEMSLVCVGGYAGGCARWLAQGLCRWFIARGYIVVELWLMVVVVDEQNLCVKIKYLI